MQKRYMLLAIFIIVAAAGTVFFYRRNEPFINPIGPGKPKDKPLLAYAFTNLKHTTFQKSTIMLGPVLGEKPDSTEQSFYFTVPEKPGEKPVHKVSGVLNRPKADGTYPIIIMFRGFIPDESYVPGAGTQHVAEVLAQKGYITLAPDFLGFGQSDKPSLDGFEARFQTYTTALTLIASLPNLNTGLDASYSGTLRADTGKVGIWGHSNGGHIALAVLSISGAHYPTVLWAPVSKSFPYSILYYTDESDDQGKALRKAVASFEDDYNADLFSPAAYYSWIKAPLAIMQGTDDREVPVWWSNDLTDSFKKQKLDISYTTYSGADHNMMPSGWSPAVGDSVAFYNGKLSR